MKGKIPESVKDFYFSGRSPVKEKSSAIGQYISVHLQWVSLNHHFEINLPCHPNCDRQRHHPFHLGYILERKLKEEDTLK